MFINSICAALSSRYIVGNGILRLDTEAAGYIYDQSSEPECRDIAYVTMIRAVILEDSPW